MKDVLSSFLHLLKINGVSYILATYDGKIIDKSAGNSEQNSLKLNEVILHELTSKIKFNRKSPSFSIHRTDNYIILENPLYQKIVVIDKTDLKDISVTDLYFITELLNSIDESIIILDNSNKILYTNYIFSVRYGFNESALMGSYFSEMLPPQYLEDVLTGMKEGRNNFTLEIYDKSGDLASAKIHVIPWGDIKILLLHDIQEKEGWSRQIEGLKRMQDLIFDSIAQGIVVLDKEGNIIKFNRFTQDRYGFSKEKIIGKNIFTLFPDYLKLKLDKTFAEIIELKKSKKILGLRRYSRTMKKEVIQNLYGYPIVEGGRGVGAVILIDDITEKKMLEVEYEMVQKKSEIVNDLNSILSETIEMNPMVSNISKYLNSHLSYSRLFLINRISDKICEFKSKEMYQCQETKLVASLQKLSEVKVSQVRFFSTKEELKKIASNAKTKCVVLIPVMFNKMHYADFVMEFNTDVSNDRNTAGFLEAFSNHIGIVFDKAITYEEKKENLKKLEFILKISKVLSQTKEYQKTFRNLLEIISEELKADRCFFVVKTDYEDEMKAVAALGVDQEQIMAKSFRMGQGIIGTVAKTNEPLIFENALEFKNLEYTKGFKKKKQAVIAVPVNFKGELVGVLMISRFGENPFSSDDFEMVKIIANNSSSYVKSLLLQMDTENKIEQLSFLYKIFTSIRTISNIQLLKRIVTTTLGSMAKSDFTLLLKYSDGKIVPNETYFSNPAYKEYLKTKKEYRVEQFNSLSYTTHFDSESKPVQALCSKKIAKMIVLPINISVNYKYFLVLCYEKNNYEKITDDTFNAIIQELGMKFENAVLFQENEKKIKQYNIISKLAAKLTDIKNIEEYFNYLLSSAIEIVDGTIATLLLKDGKYLVFKSASGVDLELIRDIKIKIGVGIAGNVALTGKSAMVNNTKTDEHFVKLSKLSQVYTVYNMVNVPLTLSGEIVGVLCVDNKKNGNFDQSDVQFLETLASTAIIALEQFVGGRYEKVISELILENLPSGVIYINSKGIIKHVNRAFSKISKYTEKDSLGRNYQDYFIDKNNIITRVIKTEKPIFRSEIELKSKAGSFIPCGISITPIKTKKELDVVCIIQDLSEIKKIQNELKAKENLAVLGQMAAGMAHEIKNPLAGILTGMEFLKMQIGDENTIYGESIDLIIKEVRRLDRIVNDMTSFAKTKTKIITKSEISNVIEHALDVVRDRLKESQIAVEKQIPENLAMIDVDEEQIVEVLINIFLNAVQAIDKGGKISILLSQNEKEMLIDVFNSGPHISEDIADKIFTPFFTTKSGGTGLGLAISYNIIKEHGGTIKAINRENGVSFVISLPFAVKNE
jgi:PAS domain S-box-containing protein